MNITAISGNTTALTPRTPALDNSAGEIAQTRLSQSYSTQNLTEQATTEVRKSEFPREQLEDAVKQINDFLKPVNSAIQFSLDDETGTTVIKIVDTATKEVLRQVPSEEMLRIARALDKIAGVLIQQKA